MNKQKSPTTPPVVPDTAQRADSVDAPARQFLTREERAKLLLAPIIRAALEEKEYLRRQVEAANFGSDEERAHREKFDGYLPGLSKMIRQSRSALRFYNEGAERYRVDPISPALDAALKDCASEIDARVERASAAEKAAHKEMVRAVPRLGPGRRPDPDALKQAVALLRAEGYPAPDAKRHARKQLALSGLIAPKK